MISNYWIYYSYSCRLFLLQTQNKDEWLAICENSTICVLRARFCRLLFGLCVKLQNNYHQLTEVIWVLCTSQENVLESLLLNHPFGLQSSTAMIVAFLRRFYYRKTTIETARQTIPPNNDEWMNQRKVIFPHETFLVEVNRIHANVQNGKISTQCTYTQLTLSCARLFCSVDKNK